ncbi:MAG: hypothetical protein FJ104_11625, partial [Deltaproteobacteria bacterium]|nr:hypothetical protein [Deltaproteobacteria bacterium]
PVPDGGGPPVQIPPFQITDLDLSPDGTFALGVLRELGLVVKIPVPGGFADPSTIEVLPTGGVFVGSAEISSGGRVALLYTNADPSVEAVVILPLDGAAPRPVALEKGVLAVAIAPDEETAFIVHSRQPGDPAEPGLDLDAQIDRQEGYSLLRIDENFPTLAVTPVAPGPFALTPDGERLFVLFAGPGLAEVHSVDLVRSQAAVIPLGSRPLSVGAMPGSTSVFVGQDHPDGRLSFIDWQTGLVQTVTGFELNGRIRE